MRLPDQATTAAALLAAAWLSSHATARAADWEELTSLPPEHVIGFDALDANGRRLAVLQTDARNCARAGLMTVEPPAAKMLGEVATPSEPCHPLRMSLSADGGTLVVFDGAAARAQVLRPENGELAVDGELVIPGTEGFGPPTPAQTVAVDETGELVVLGAANFDCRMGIPNSLCGAAHVYRRGETGWSHAQALPYPMRAASNIEYGRTVALAPNGEVLAVGGLGRHATAGMLYSFLREGDSFRPGPIVVPPVDRRDQFFARSAAFDHAGKLLAVGGDQAVDVFVRDGSNFSLASTLAAPDPDAGMFGSAVAISGDGGSLLVGAPASPCADRQPRCGRAYLYQRPAQGEWQLAARIENPLPAAYADFGYRLALDADGGRAAIQGEVATVFGR